MSPWHCNTPASQGQAQNSSNHTAPLAVPSKPYLKSKLQETDTKFYRDQVLYLSQCRYVLELLLTRMTWKVNTTARLILSGKQLLCNTLSAHPCACYLVFQYQWSKDSCQWGNAMMRRHLCISLNKPREAEGVISPQYPVLNLCFTCGAPCHHAGSRILTSFFIRKQSFSLHEPRPTDGGGNGGCGSCQKHIKWQEKELTSGFQISFLLPPQKSQK